MLHFILTVAVWYTETMEPYLSFLWSTEGMSLRKLAWHIRN